MRNRTPFTRVAAGTRIAVVARRIVGHGQRHAHAGLLVAGVFGAGRVIYRLAHDDGDRIELAILGRLVAKKAARALVPAIEFGAVGIAGTASVFAGLAGASHADVAHRALDAVVAKAAVF